MKVTLSCILATMRIIAVSALLIFACMFASTSTVSLSKAGYALLGGVAVAVFVYCLGIFMTVWASRRHDVVPEGTSVEPIDEFDVFR